MVFNLGDKAIIDKGKHKGMFVTIDRYTNKDEMIMGTVIDDVFYSTDYMRKPIKEEL